MSTPTPETGKSSGKGRLLLALIPLLVFGAIAAGAAKILYEQDVNGKDISEIPSALIGTRAPSLALAPLEGSGVPALTDAAIAGKLTVVNVFASWCIPCRDEHPILLELSKDKRLNIVGINYKDKTEGALAFLKELGNPYAAIGVDPKGAAAIDWGVYGIPETYLVGPDGTILYKRVGPFDQKSLAEGFYPAVEAALKKQGS